MPAIYIAGNYLIVDDETKVRQLPSRDLRYTRGNTNGTDTIEVFPIEPGLYENVKFVITDATEWDSDDSGTAYDSMDALETILQNNLSA